MKRVPGLYRQNVAIIFRRSDGKILICERSKHLGSWQFPQGGVDEGESAEVAMMREAEEEVAYKPEQYKVIEAKGPYHYNYPVSRLSEVHHYRGIPYVGQEQTYFLCDLLSDIDPTVDQHEFRDFRWIQPREFDIDCLPAFKRVVYQRVLADFFALT